MTGCAWNMALKYASEPKYERTKSMSVSEYHAAAKGESWKCDWSIPLMSV
jgi:hypothetical protein